MQQEQDDFPLQEITYKASTITNDADGALKPVNVRRKIPLYLLIVTATANLLSLSTGTAAVWVAPVIPKLKKNTTENPLGYAINHIEEAWVAALLPLGAALGPLVAGRIADEIGRKIALLVIACVHVVSLLITTFGKTILLYFIARLLIGISVGSTYGVLPMFLAEISENHNRGAIVCSVSIFVAVGANTSLIIGPYLTIQNFCLVLLTPLIVFLPSFFILSPESPAYLASNKNEKDVSDVLFKLRKNPIAEINSEVATILDTARKTAARASIKEMLQTRATRKGLIIALGLVIFQQSSGMGAILAFMPAIFKAGGGSLSPEVSTMLIGTFQVVGTVLATVIVDRLGRKILLLGSSIGMTITLTSLGVYFYLKDKQVSLEWCSWLPVLSLIIWIVSFSIGFGPVPWTVTSEVFLPNFRATALSIISFSCFITTFIITVTFPSLVLYLSMAKCFLIFSLISIGATVFIYWILPETKGKSIQEIQQLLSN